jgi:DeoR/GlpR family transcriptional regulator of sugar metabolism
VIRVGDVTAEFGCSNSTAKRDITELRDRGLIVFEGKARTGFYRMV